jgi:hypothetical protein
LLEIKTNFAQPKDSQCPSIEENRQKYLLLPPSAKDQTNGEELIKWVKVNAYHLYLKYQE